MTNSLRRSTICFCIYFETYRATILHIFYEWKKYVYSFFNKLLSIIDEYQIFNWSGDELAISKLYNRMRIPHKKKLYSCNQKFYSCNVKFFCAYTLVPSFHQCTSRVVELSGFVNFCRESRQPDVRAYSNQPQVRNLTHDVNSFRNTILLWNNNIILIWKTYKIRLHHIRQ